MRAKFIGDPLNGGDGPNLTKTLGHTFRKGEWTPVSEAAYAKLLGNRHFITNDAAFNGADLASFDHDGDGAPGGSLADGETIEDLREEAERAAILAELERLDAPKPHHKTGLTKLRETLTAARAAKEAADWEEGA